MFRHIASSLIVCISVLRCCNVWYVGVVVQAS